MCRQLYLCDGPHGWSWETGCRPGEDLIAHSPLVVQLDRRWYRVLAAQRLRELANNLDQDVEFSLALILRLSEVGATMTCVRCRGEFRLEIGYNVEMSGTSQCLCDTRVAQLRPELLDARAIANKAAEAPYTVIAEAETT